MRDVLSVADLKRELEARGLRLTRKLGQNLCVDTNAAQAIVRDAGVGQGDLVLEVGAGAGHLTVPLLETGAHVLAVELDGGLLGLLTDRLSRETRLTTLNEDILAGKHRLNPRVTDRLLELAGVLGAEKFLVAANLPYSVATPFLLELAVSGLPWRAATVTVQADVAERLTAVPATKAYGAASVVAQVFCQVRRLRTLPPEVFWPRPGVTSAVVKLTPSAGKDIPPALARPAFAAFVRELMLHRRKKLKGVLGRCLEKAGGGGAEAVLASAGIDGNMRPDALAAGRFLALYGQVRHAAHRPAPPFNNAIQGGL